MATDATGTPTSPDSIPTYNTSADAPSGLGFNAAMAAIQTGLSARISKPAGIVSGEVPVWNGSTWVRSSATPLTAGIGAANLAVNVGSANTDLVAPTSMLNFWYASASGGTLRSIASGASLGQTVTLRNDLTAITLKHQLAGGSGAKLYLLGAVDAVLTTSGTITLMWDGTNWSEVARDKPVPSAKLRGSATQSIPNSAVTTVTVLDTTDWSVGGATRSGSTILLPESGIYAARTHINFAANTTGFREVYIVKAGAIIGYEAMLATSFSTGSVELQCSCQFQAAAGDAVSLQVNQTSGGALAIDLGTGSFYRGLEVTRIA